MKAAKSRLPLRRDQGKIDRKYSTSENGSVEAPQEDFNITDDNYLFTLSHSEPITANVFKVERLNLRLTRTKLS